MPGLTLRDLPEELLERLRTLARKERRSLNQEVIVLLEAACRGEAPGALSVPAVLDLETQARLLGTLAGRWQGKAEAGRLVREIYEARTAGRGVDLS